MITHKEKNAKSPQLRAYTKLQSVALKNIDLDDDDKLDATELAKACKITVTEAKETIEEYDVNGDGQLDKKEFEALKKDLTEPLQSLDKPLCPNSHSLIQYKQDIFDYHCDLCRVFIDRGAESYGCYECYYGICARCYNKNEQEAKQETTEQKPHGRTNTQIVNIQDDHKAVEKVKGFSIGDFFTKCVLPVTGILALFDMITDIQLMIKVQQNKSLWWVLVIMVISIITPYLIAYSSGAKLVLAKGLFDNFNKKHIAQKFLLILYLSPLGAFYYVLIDLYFIVTKVFYLWPLSVCRLFKNNRNDKIYYEPTSNNDDPEIQHDQTNISTHDKSVSNGDHDPINTENIEFDMVDPVEASDKDCIISTLNDNKITVGKYVFMSLMDYEGYSQLRAITQLIFESLPQVFLQFLMYVDVVQISGTTVTDFDVIKSLIPAVLNVIITFALLSIEAKIWGESNIMYCLTSIIGKFGWIPFQRNIKFNNMLICYCNSCKCHKYIISVSYYFSRMTLIKLTEDIIETPVTEQTQTQPLQFLFGDSCDYVDVQTVIQFMQCCKYKAKINDLEKINWKSCINESNMIGQPISDRVHARGANGEPLLKMVLLSELDSNLVVFNQLIENKVNLNVVDQFGDTVLHWCIKNPDDPLHYKAFKILLDQDDIIIKTENNLKRTPIQDAIDTFVKIEYKKQQLNDKDEKKEEEEEKNDILNSFWKIITNQYSSFDEIINTKDIEYAGSNGNSIIFLDLCKFIHDDKYKQQVHGVLMPQMINIADEHCYGWSSNKEIQKENEQAHCETYFGSYCKASQVAPQNFTDAQGNNLLHVLAMQTGARQRGITRKSVTMIIPQSEWLTKNEQGDTFLHVAAKYKNQSLLQWYYDKHGQTKLDERFTSSMLKWSQETPNTATNNVIFKTIQKWIGEDLVQITEEKEHDFQLGDDATKRQQQLLQNFDSRWTKEIANEYWSKYGEHWVRDLNKNLSAQDSSDEWKNDEKKKDDQEYHEQRELFLKNNEDDMSKDDVNFSPMQWKDCDLIEIPLLQSSKVSELTQKLLLKNAKANKLLLDPFQSVNDNYQKNRAENINSKCVQLLSNISSFVIEAISAADLVTDILILKQFILFQDIWWSTLTVTMMLAPYYVAFANLVYLLQVRKKLSGSITNNMLGGLFLTPFAIIYCIIVDIIFIIYTVITQLFFMLFCACGSCNATNDDVSFFEKQLMHFFGLTMMDIRGYRKLRSIAQICFESIPQIFLQIRILNIGRGNDVGIDQFEIILSILFALMHSIIEGTILFYEAKATKLNFFHYLVHCVNGRVGFIPFIHTIKNNSVNKMDKCEPYDFSLIHETFGGIQFSVEYEFSKTTFNTFIADIAYLPEQFDVSKCSKVVLHNQQLKWLDLFDLSKLCMLAQNKIKIEFHYDVDFDSLLNRAYPFNKRNESEELLDPIDGENLLYRFMLSQQYEIVRVLLKHNTNRPDAVSVHTTNSNLLLQVIEQKHGQGLRIMLECINNGKYDDLEFFCVEQTAVSSWNRDIMRPIKYKMSAHYQVKDMVCDQDDISLHHALTLSNIALNKKGTENMFKAIVEMAKTCNEEDKLCCQKLIAAAGAMDIENKSLLKYIDGITQEPHLKEVKRMYEELMEEKIPIKFNPLDENVYHIPYHLLSHSTVFREIVPIFLDYKSNTDHNVVLVLENSFDVNDHERIFILMMKALKYGFLRDIDIVHGRKDIDQLDKLFKALKIAHGPTVRKYIRATSEWRIKTYDYYEYMTERRWGNEVGIDRNILTFKVPDNASFIYKLKIITAAKSDCLREWPVTKSGVWLMTSGKEYVHIHPSESGFGTGKNAAFGQYEHEYTSLNEKYWLRSNEIKPGDGLTIRYIHRGNSMTVKWCKICVVYFEQQK
eukprot:277190_1